MIEATTRVQSLSDDRWEVREALGDTWQWYVRAPAPRRNSVTLAARTDAWIPAHVPGSVIDDLVRAGDIRTPYHARQSREAEWVSERHWVYRRVVEVPEATTPGGVWVEIDGIDPGGVVLWDGEPVGEVSGVHHRACIRVASAGDERGTPGLHTLSVVVRPAVDTEPQVGRTDRVRVLHPRIGSGWDFSPRMRHQGIWRDVRLVTGPVALASVNARSSVEADLRSGSVIVEGVVDAAAPTPSTLRVRIELFLDGAPVAQTSASCGAEGEFRLRLDVPDVELWHPLGHGTQTLYDVRVRAGDQTRTMRVGFRDARLVDNDGAPAGALAYTAQVNGRRLPLVGWNWAPVDTLFGTITPERTRHLVALAADSGARILRVWGGGLLESDDFYDACDEHGLLVWQEFSQSSSGMASAPAADAAFVDHVTDEANRAVQRIGHHASLFVWCGGNELEDDQGPLDEHRSPALAALRAALAAADPDRAWLPTSPSGPTFHHRLDRIAADPDGQHDVHGPWEHQGLEAHHTLADSGTNLAHTEFGVEGMASMRSLRAIVPAASLWPTDRSNPIYRHLGEWWNNAELVTDAFAARVDSVERIQRASQWLQATGLQYAIEADRRRWPRCSMVLPWQLAESFPNAWCTSAVEWSGEAKPAFHAARRAFARDRATIRTSTTAWHGRDRLTAEVWVWSEVGIAHGSTVDVRLRDVDGTVLVSRSSPVVAAVSDPRTVTNLDFPHPGTDGIVIWEAEWRDADGATIDVERSVAALGADLSALLDLPESRVTLTVTDAGESWHVRVTHVDGPAVIGGRLLDARAWGAPGRLLVRDDPRPILPGETRELSVQWNGVAPHARALCFDAWNVAAMSSPLASAAAPPIVAT